jgi:hypothetical protein
MKKSLRRVLERLRTVTNGRLHGGISIRAGLQQPQRIEPLRVSARVDS